MIRSVLHRNPNLTLYRIDIIAQQMREAERNKDILPNFQWMPSTAVEPREEHKALYYKIWPLGDPFLSTNSPGCLWGCLCSGRTTAQAPTDRHEVNEAVKATPPPARGLNENPATSGALFCASHPYIASCAGGKATKRIVELASQKLSSSISRKEVRSYFKASLTKEHIISVVNGPIKQLPLSYQDIKTITGKPHKFNYQRNQACYSLDEIFAVAKYEGASPDIKPGQLGHNSILKWHYYSFELNGEISYITIKESHGGGFGIHSIQDTDHFKNSKVKEKPKRND